MSVSVARIGLVWHTLTTRYCRHQLLESGAERGHRIATALLRRARGEDAPDV